MHCFTDEISRLKPKLLFPNNIMVNYYVFGTNFTDISIYLFSSFKTGLTAVHNHYSKYNRYNNFKIVFSQQSNAHDGEVCWRFFLLFYIKTRENIYQILNQNSVGLSLSVFQVKHNLQKLDSSIFYSIDNLMVSKLCLIFHIK